MKRMKLFFAAMLVLASVGAAGVLAMAAEAPEGSTVVTILHTNDLHGRLVGGGNVLGLDVIAAIREATPNSILVDAGDTIHGLPFVTFFEGRNAIYLMNEAGYALFAPGNHDFNYGIDALLRHEYYADFGFIASNLTWAATGRSVFDQYRVVEIDGVTLGFFGLAYPGTPSVTNPAGIVGLRFSNPIYAARASVAALKDLEVDVIVAIAHLGVDGSAWGPEVARAVPGIDIIIDGHSHTRLDEGYMVGDVLMAQAGGAWPVPWRGGNRYA
jgi:5'-nucleotidase